MTGGHGRRPAQAEALEVSRHHRVDFASQAGKNAHGTTRDIATLENSEYSTDDQRDSQGDKYSQTIEVKKDKFVFEILGADGQVVLHAEGDVKFEKLGPFDSVRFVHIRAGQSSSDMNDVDDEYVSVYRLDGDKWTMASGFDKDRERQKPEVDVYARAAK